MAQLVTEFDLIIDQALPVRILSTFLKTGSIPHALLFTGIEGVGKKTAAKTFAMALNCSGEANPSRKPCGACPPCRKIQAGHHPDILQINPTGAFIRIHQIRELIHTYTRKPYEGRYRVAIIADAHKLNIEAANAFLKLLEEPPAQSLLILTAEQTSDLLPTIVSRCRHMEFRPLGRDSIAAMLTDKHGIDASRADILAAMSGGSFTRALAMAKPAKGVDWLKRRKWLFEQLALSVDKSPAEVLCLAQQLSAQKDTVSEDLKLIKSWLRDLIVCKCGVQRMINKDLTEKIQYASQKVTVSVLLDRFDMVQSIEKKLKANTNLRLTLEIMTLKLAGLLT